MNNQVYFEINGTVKTVAAIPAQVLIILLSKQEKRTKAGISISFKVYGISTSSTFDECIDVTSCRMKSAAPTVVREYIGAASQSDVYWRTKYDKESS